MHPVLPRSAIVVAIGVCVLAATASLPAKGHWKGPGLHTVDDFVMTTETPCVPAPATDCALEAATAESELGIDPGSVLAVATAQGPDWADHDDNTRIRHIVSGASQPTFVILDLRGGARRVAQISCRAPGTAPDGSTLTVTTGRAEPSDWYRVGHTPDD